MTQKECLDAVKVRANEYQVARNLDDRFIRTQINHTLRDVNTRAFPYRMDFFLVSAVDIIATPQLPINLLGGRPARVLCTNPDDASTVEAAYASTPNEFWEIQANTRTPAANDAPVYFIGDSTTVLRTLKIWPTTIVAATADLWELPADLSITGSDAAVVMVTPPGWEVAVVYGTLMRCLNKINEKDKMEQIFKQYQSSLQAIESGAQKTQQQKRQNLQSMPLVGGTR